MAIADLALTKLNRIRLARAFRNVPRVDLGIDCAVEGQMGRAYADDHEHPVAFKIEQDPFLYFAGDAGVPAAREMVKGIAPYSLIMSAADGWIRLASDIHGDRLVAMRRYSFSSRKLSIGHLDDLLCASGQQARLRRMDAGLSVRAANAPGGFVDMSAFDSPADFEERGVGFCALGGDAIVGASYSSLVSCSGIEVSISVEPEYRRRGVATALASALLKHCLELGTDPHWDAANPESCRLGEKLGYIASGEYEAQVLLAEAS